MEWEIVIGIETHVQLKTNSKIFSGASTSFGRRTKCKCMLSESCLPWSSYQS